jgi:hypothetical protein
MKIFVSIPPLFSDQTFRTLPLLGAACLLALVSTPLVTAEFTPGGGGSVPNLPELQEPASSITSLWVSQTDRENYHFIPGNEPMLDLKFSSPASYGATGFDLQKSLDGMTDWETLYSTTAAGQDNFSFNPGGHYYFRLLVHGGPRDGQISNVVAGEVSLLPTQFFAWGGGSNWIPGAPMAPWLGHGLIAYFQARNLGDSSPVTGGIGFQWYRRNPQTGALIPISGATQDTYTTTEDDLGGYQLFCRGTGDGSTVGGYAQQMLDESVVIFNRAEATAVSRRGFTLNLYKSVPSLTSGDLKLAYWDGPNEVEIPISAVTTHLGNAVFDIEADVPIEVTDATLSNRSGVWKIGSQFGEDEWGHQMPDLMITFPAAGGATFAEWVVETGIPEGQRGPLDRNGPLMVQNLMAYTMGLNPLTITKEEMPEVTRPDPVAGTLHLIYQRAKNLNDASLTLRISPDLSSWSAANIVAETVMEDGGDWEKVDATIEFTPGPTAFLDFAAEQQSGPRSR